MSVLSNTQNAWSPRRLMTMLPISRDIQKLMEVNEIGKEKVSPRVELGLLEVFETERIKIQCDNHYTKKPRRFRTTRIAIGI